MVEDVWKALALTEADCQDVRIVQDDDHGLAIGSYPTLRDGTKLLLVMLEPSGKVVRMRLSMDKVRALKQMCVAVLAAEEE